MNFNELKNLGITDFAASTAGKSYLLQYGDRYFEVNAFTAELFKWLQQYDSQEEAVSAYRKCNEGKLSEEELNAFISGFLKKLDSGAVRKKTFIYKHELLPASIINRYSKACKVLFRKKIMGAIIVLFLLLEGYFFIDFSFSFSLPEFNFYMIGALLTFFVFSSLFHELGHASACQYFNISHGGIGFGLYINFPVFYTDVSQVWKLPRTQRCIVNMAGVYFQTLLLIPLFLYYFYSGNPIAKYVILMMNINFLITLNPFFKFDGYWLMTDLLGVANLRQKSNELLGYICRHMRKQSVGKKPYLFSLRRREKIFMTIYTSVVNIFFAYYFFYLLPLFFIKFYGTFPLRFKIFMMELGRRQMPDFHNIQQMFVQLLFLGLVVYMLYKILVPFMRRIIKWK